MSIQKYLRKNSFKIVLCGDGAVGKTTISRRLTKKYAANENTNMTLGVEFHNLKIPNSEQNIYCQIWDLGGQHQFKGFHEVFFAHATVVILTFAVNMYRSFKNLDFWLPFISKEMLKKTYLLGNKIDFINRSVRKEDAIEFAKQKEMTYFEISAKTGKGIEEFKSDLINTIESIYQAKK